MPTPRPATHSPLPAGAATPAAELWNQVSIPSVDWARRHPEKLMAFLMVAQMDFPQLSEMLK